MKLVALFKPPDDPDAFDRAYFGMHLPLIAKVPGLTRTVVTRVERLLMGEELYMLTEMYFKDEKGLKNGLRSPEMAAAGENLDSFAKGLVTLLYGEEQEQP